MESYVPKQRRLVVVSGPSGVGKSTLCQKLIDVHPTMFTTTVSHTTRKPRQGEIEGESYYYISKDEFLSLIASNAFIEYAEFNGHLYGTSKRTVVDHVAKDSVVILDIEMEGVKQLKKEQMKGNSQINPRFVFINPPNVETLEARLRSRGSEDEDSIRRRLTQARAEMEYAETGAHDKVITNENLEVAFQELQGFIFNGQ